MTEFTIYNEKTNEERIIFGYNEKDAFDKTNYDRKEWQTIFAEYID